MNQTAFKNDKAILDYIIVDGGSTDGTLEIINKTISSHKLKNCVTVISEPDKGMYEALVKGMKKAHGEIFSYINSDDYYNITAVEIVISIMDKYSVKWLTGWAAGYNEYGHITAMNSQYLFRNDFILKGVYGTKLPHLQQESTFWRKELNENLDFEKLRNLKYAGDYYLWIEFSKICSLYIVETYLGGFRSRVGQLSKQMEKYNAEKQELLNGHINIFNKIIIIKDKIFSRINKMTPVFNCVKNEMGEYVHFVYNYNTEEWVPLSMELIIRKIKSKIFISQNML
jgi:glycosyltransferase involved in cell wall biosynthesis